MHGNLVDLHPPATEANRTFAAHHVENRATTTPQSFFDPLPRGTDAYLLADILHDWDDRNAHRILAGASKPWTRTATSSSNRSVAASPAPRWTWPGP